MKRLFLPIIAHQSKAFNTEVMDPSQLCPAFTCETLHNGGINMDEQVFCYRNEVDNPFSVKLKTCIDG
jgi:hypothetical protein